MGFRVPTIRQLWVIVIFQSSKYIFFHSTLVDVVNTGNMRVLAVHPLLTLLLQGLSLILTSLLPLGRYVAGRCFRRSDFRSVYARWFESLCQLEGRSTIVGNTVEDRPYSLFTAIISISLSLHLVLLAPVNSCELHNYHLVLSFLFMYSSSGLSTDVFFLIKRI